MRNYSWLSAVSALSLSLLAGGCGGDTKGITVKGTTLVVTEATYGMSASAGGLFCTPLVGDQFEVFLSDVDVCASAMAKVSATTAFHSRANTKLRLVFPGSTLFKKNPNGTFKTNSYKVLKTGGCKIGGGAEAVAFFTHAAGAGEYDVNEEATAGTISVTDFTSTMSNIKGTYDLTFGTGDHITGDFEAFPCPAIPVEYNQ